MDMLPEWLDAIRSWVDAKPEIAEVWLFGSRAKGTARPDSDADLGLVLVPGEPSAPGKLGHDWPLGNWLSLGSTWRNEVRGIIGRHVSLEVFSRPGETQSEEEIAARQPAILIWARP